MVTLSLSAACADEPQLRTLSATDPGVRSARYLRHGRASRSDSGPKMRGQHVAPRPFTTLQIVAGHVADLVVHCNHPNTSFLPLECAASPPSRRRSHRRFAMVRLKGL